MSERKNRSYMWTGPKPLKELTAEVMKWVEKVLIRRDPKSKHIWWFIMGKMNPDVMAKAKSVKGKSEMISSAPWEKFRQVGADYELHEREEEILILVRKPIPKEKRGDADV